MMQSILLTTANKAPIAEQAGNTKASEENKGIEGEAGEEKASLDFASVLDELSSEGEVQSTGEEGLIVEELLSVEETLSADEEALVADEEAAELALLSEQAEPMKDAVSQEKPTEEKDETYADGVNLQQDSEVINPIIAQIESAQKTDTKVKDNSTSMMVQESAIGTKNSDKEESPKSLAKNNKLKFEQLLTGDSSTKELSTKEISASNNKLDAIISSLGGEANKPVFNQHAETNMLQAVSSTSSNIDRPLQQAATTNTQTLLQSAALQQPIELQSKHGSAAIGERIMMMLNQGKQEVTIRLDPAELGSLQIKLHVQQDQVQVAIQAQVGQSRDLIEQNLPRLREQLAQEGINLGEASVEQQGKDNQSNAQDSDRVAGSARRGGSTDELIDEPQSEWLTTQIPLSAQGIDYYA